MRRAKLEEFCDFSAGGKLGLTKGDYVAQGFPAFSAAGQDGCVSVAEFKRPGVIVSAIGARCGKAFLAQGAWTTLANTYAVLPNVEVCHPSFLWYQLNDETSWRRSGTAQPFIKPKDIKQREVALPPLPEQRRIVEILDMADRLRKLRAQADAKVERILPALFIKMFGDPAKNPKQWPIGTFREVMIDDPQNGLYKPGSFYGTGTLILRIDGFYSGEVLDVSTFKRIDITDSERETYSLKVNDIVVNRVNSEQYLGKSAIIRELAEPLVFESNMMRIRIGADMLAEFVIAHLQTEATRRELLQRAKRAINQASINQQDVMRVAIMRPPTELQRVFAAHAARLRLEHARQTATRVSIGKIFDSLLQRAFAGNLTVQNNTLGGLQREAATGNAN